MIKTLMLAFKLLVKTDRCDQCCNSLILENLVTGDNWQPLELQGKKEKSNEVKLCFKAYFFYWLMFYS